MASDRPGVMPRTPLRRSRGRARSRTEPHERRRRSSRLPRASSEQPLAASRGSGCERYGHAQRDQSDRSPCRPRQRYEEPVKAPDRAQRLKHRHRRAERRSTRFQIQHTEHRARRRGHQPGSPNLRHEQPRDHGHAPREQEARDLRQRLVELQSGHVSSPPGPPAGKRPEDHDDETRRTPDSAPLTRDVDREARRILSEQPAVAKFGPLHGETPRRVLGRCQ